MTARPLYWDDKPALSATALKLRAKRMQGDAALVEAGKLTAEQAADRARTSLALAQQWQSIIRREPIPDLPATSAEILADLAAIAEAADAFARRSPGIRDVLTDLRAETAADWLSWKLGWPERDLPAERFEVSATDFAALVRALHWHQRPWVAEAGTATVVFLHEVNLHFWRGKAA